MYDPREKELTQLGGKITSELDQEYLGNHEQINGVLPDFVKGDIVRATKEKRNSYLGDTIIEMSKIRMDFARNEITGQTLRIIDREFFDQIVANGGTRVEEKKEGPNFAELSTRAADGIRRML